MKKLEIEIPNGKEIDWEASAQQKQVVFKDKQFTYDDMCQKLFRNGYCYIGMYGQVATNGRHEHFRTDPSNAKTAHQLDCILAKNMLANVAVYLNNGWKPDLNKDCGYCLILDDSVLVDSCTVQCPYSSGQIMFKSSELAQQAIEILGEDMIKLALEPLY